MFTKQAKQNTDIFEEEARKQIEELQQTPKENLLLQCWKLGTISLLKKRLFKPKKSLNIYRNTWLGACLLVANCRRQHSRDQRELLQAVNCAGAEPFQKHLKRQNY